MKALITLEIENSTKPEQIYSGGITAEHMKTLWALAFQRLLDENLSPGTTGRVASVDLVDNTKEESKWNEPTF